MERLPVHLLVVSIGLALAGCAGGGESSKQNSKDASGQSRAFGASSKWLAADPAMVQRDVMNFADRFAGNMADTYDELAARSTTAAAKDAALQRKIGNVTAAYVNASEPNPIVGLIDMIVTVTLLREASQEAWYTELHGAAAANVMDVLKAEEDDIWNIGSRYLTESQLAELRAAIDRWGREHPGQRYVSMVRLADFPEAKTPPPADKNKGPTSVFGLIFLDPLAGLDPSIREVVRAREGAERMFFYAQRMPIILSWQAEALLRRMLESPAVTQAAGAATRFSDFADSAQILADSVKRLPQTIAAEREQAVDLVAEKVAAERDAALRQTAEIIAAQRDAAIKQMADVISSERTEVARITTQTVESEREKIVAAWNASLQSQRQALMTDVDTVSRHATIRISVVAGLVVSLGILLTALAVLIVRRIAPRAAVDNGNSRGYTVETGANENEIRITQSK